ncbi:hypothetical protein A8U91_03045 [Halomonas elongata]|uniref:Uncharacterized protein n=1 Tax=Halomonas elongata TaxID=2746 RepID=A0A1B8NVF3_HALEL|nr:hypothetical protein A8U91_03045 [Halomonas elongata]
MNENSTTSPRGLTERRRQPAARILSRLEISRILAVHRESGGGPDLLNDAANGSLLRLLPMAPAMGGAPYPAIPERSWVPCEFESSFKQR